MISVLVYSEVLNLLNQLRALLGCHPETRNEAKDLTLFHARFLPHAADKLFRMTRIRLLDHRQTQECHRRPVAAA